MKFNLYFNLILQEMDENFKSQFESVLYSFSLIRYTLQMIDSGNSSHSGPDPSK